MSREGTVEQTVKKETNDRTREEEHEGNGSEDEKE